MLWIPRPWNPCRFCSSFLLSWASHTKSGTLNTNPISMKWKATELTTPIGFKSTECVPEDTKPISKKLIATTSSFSLIDSGPKKGMWPNPVIIGEIIAPNSQLTICNRSICLEYGHDWMKPNYFTTNPNSLHLLYINSSIKYRITRGSRLIESRADLKAKNSRFLPACTDQRWPGSTRSHRRRSRTSLSCASCSSHNTPSTESRSKT